MTMPGKISRAVLGRLAPSSLSTPPPIGARPGKAGQSGNGAITDKAATDKTPVFPVVGRNLRDMLPEDFMEDLHGRSPRAVVNRRGATPEAVRVARNPSICLA
jgi:hypothetical protein